MTDKILDDLETEVRKLRDQNLKFSDARLGWIYLMPTVRLVEGMRIAKIGFSADVKERSRTICTNTPHAMNVNATRGFIGTTSHETQFKLVTSAYTTDASNEWRQFPPGVYAMLESLLSPIPLL